MKTKDGLNYFLEVGDTFTCPSLDTKLTKNFYVRELHQHPMQSQDGGWDKTFKRDEWSGTAWHKVEDEMTAWIDKTYMDFMKFAAKSHNNPDPYDFLIHEIIYLKEI